ncbi:hypothetical protein [Phytohabitans rumicis]|uniref:LysM domain-containing protein n=1 Tax=Phytohabitans rumicis TaxID=1076125 RepID=A0A6V8KYJ0_9ACTN|nr:hypothetical protein [Phytohabitans rumicis]GFJ88450.1 hypothetical protein Prum_020920 [Phytohabitans rumicis]
MRSFRPPYLLAPTAALFLILGVIASVAWPDAPPTVMVAEQARDGAALDQEALDRTQQDAAALGAEAVLVVVPADRPPGARIQLRVTKDDRLAALATRFRVDVETLVRDNPGAFDKDGAPTKPGKTISVRIDDPYRLPDGQALLSSRAVTGAPPDDGPPLSVVFTASGAGPVVDALGGLAVVVDGTGAVLARPEDGGVARSLRILVLVTWVPMVVLLVALAVRRWRRPPPEPVRAERAPASSVFGPASSGLRSEATREDGASQARGPVRAERAPASTAFDFSPWAVAGPLTEPAEQCPQCGAFDPVGRQGAYRCTVCGDSWVAQGRDWPKVLLGGAGTFTDEVRRQQEGISQ